GQMSINRPNYLRRHYAGAWMLPKRISFVNVGGFMPGWLIHIDAARRALANLSAFPTAAPVLGDPGPSAGSLQNLAAENPAYMALGAIGPDLFFLLPDFKPPAGSMLYGAAETIRNIYVWWDDNFLGPYET